ncbi:MAG: tetraacyldisaccharide 4'-kinase [Rickettsiales bacterium]|nr:tetraacyldisaccharide 4'-kinase [Rickettsiales bacterium]
MAVSATQQFFERLWYRPTVRWLWLFLPLQLLLRLVVLIRRKLYALGLFKSTRLSKPVVVIGNITVGGTGKTPLAIYILEWLLAEGYKPGLVTRGYGGSATNYPLVLGGKSNQNSLEPSVTGDEPFLIHQRTGALVAVDPVRSRGGQKLVELGCDIIICDDGLQHYALERDLELVVIDAKRQFGNGWLMPMGPLREPKSRLKSTDLAVINGDTMRLKPGDITALGHDKELLSKKVNAVAAIGNPQRFFDTLENLGYKPTPMAFPDHHQYTRDDFASLDGPIVMTEKDAVKCQRFADDRMYYLPVSTELEAALATELKQKITALLATKA